MSENNGSGVIRIGRKGLKRFAFGDDGEPFEVDVVVAFQEWVGIDNDFRERSDDRSILTQDMPAYHQAAVEFVERLANPIDALGDPTSKSSAEPGSITTAEALDFIARLREQYDEVAAFFQPKSRDEPDSSDTLAVEHRFSVEGS